MYSSSGADQDIEPYESCFRHPAFLYNKKSFSDFNRGSEELHAGLQRREDFLVHRRSEIPSSAAGERWQLHDLQLPSDSQLPRVSVSVRIRLLQRTASSTTQRNMQRHRQRHLQRSQPRPGLPSRRASLQSRVCPSAFGFCVVFAGRELADSSKSVTSETCFTCCVFNLNEIHFCTVNVLPVSPCHAALSCRGHFCLLAMSSLGEDLADDKAQQTECFNQK